MTDFFADLFRSPDERWADFKAEQEKKEAQEAQRRAKEDREREEKQRELERQMQEVRERIQQLIRAGEEAAAQMQRDMERDEALRVLEPWQKKLIGHQARYTDGWMGKILHAISDNFGEAITCFAPTLIHGEMRPPCHFDPALMAKFYNETGILPDEVSIVSDMMEETMKIADSNYTDVQWRTKLMPTIIKGSYHRQLAGTLETKSITSEKEIDRLIKTHAKVKRKDTAQSLCEQFFMATSGAIGQQRNYAYYTPVPYDAENRNVFNEKCMSRSLRKSRMFSEHSKIWMRQTVSRSMKKWHGWIV